jgi:SAM-dependent methyltransferase
MDPCSHRHVVTVDEGWITYVCGCVNTIDRETGVLRSVTKCPGHVAAQRDPAGLGYDYYAEMGVFVDHVPQCGPYTSQLTEALGPIPPAGSVVEVGCGVGLYVRSILASGNRYLGIEPSAWAACWTRETYGVDVIEASFEAVAPRPGQTLMIAAHVVEHLADGPGAFAHLGQWLAPGGQLWVVVPDDTDPLNPDHRWFFDESTLQTSLERAGFAIETLTSRRVIERENFLYCRSRKIGRSDTEVAGG